MVCTDEAAEVLCREWEAPLLKDKGMCAGTGVGEQVTSYVVFLIVCAADWISWEAEREG